MEKEMGKENETFNFWSERERERERERESKMRVDGVFP